MENLSRLVTRAEEIEAAVLTETLVAAPATVAIDLGLLLVTDGGAVAGLVSSVDALSLNRVVGLGVSTPATESQLDRILAFARAGGVKRIFLQIAPTARPSGLTAWLEARGAQTYNRWVRMWRDTAAPLGELRATDLTIQELGPGDAGAFAGLVREAFGFPPAVDGWIAGAVGRPGWSHYGAWDGSELVATGAMYLLNHTAWFGFGATSANHRGRGAQSALIAHRVREATKMGCDWIVSETAEELPDRPAPSYHNLERLGFTEGYRRQNYALTLAEMTDRH